MTTRTLIKHLAAATDGPVSVSGWVDTVRDQKKVQFVVLRDESGAVQLVHPRAFAEDGTPEADALAETISGLAQGTFLTATVIGLSDRLLAQRLKELERDLLIERHVIATTPVQVRYVMTERGQDLLDSLQPLVGWGQKYGTPAAN